jgi:hypothetical protein
MRYNGFITSVLIASEIILANWFLFGIARRAAKLTACMLLACFICFNFIKVLDHAESCGCFGQVQVAPVYMLIGEVALLAIFVAVVSREPWKPIDTQAVRVLLNTTIVSGVLAFLGWQFLTFAPHNDSIHPQYIQLIDDAPPSSTTTFVLNWTNTEAERVQLIFLRSSCNCMSIRTLPIWVMPSGTASLKISFTTPSSIGKYERRFTLLTSTGIVYGAVHGTVTVRKREIQQ